MPQFESVGSACKIQFAISQLFTTNRVDTGAYTIFHKSFYANYLHKTHFYNTAPSSFSLAINGATGRVRTSTAAEEAVTAVESTAAGEMAVAAKGRLAGAAEESMTWSAAPATGVAGASVAWSAAPATGVAEESVTWSAAPATGAAGASVTWSAAPATGAAGAAWQAWAAGGSAAIWQALAA